jgi:hypothetical protein
MLRISGFEFQVLAAYFLEHSSDLATVHTAMVPTSPSPSSMCAVCDRILSIHCHRIHRWHSPLLCEAISFCPPLYLPSSSMWSTEAEAAHSTQSKESIRWNGNLPKGGWKLRRVAHDVTSKLLTRLRGRVDECVFFWTFPLLLFPMARPNATFVIDWNRIGAILLRVC